MRTNEPVITACPKGTSISGHRKKLAIIDSWENSKKAALEAKLKKTEMSSFDAQSISKPMPMNVDAPEQSPIADEQEQGKKIGSTEPSGTTPSTGTSLKPPQPPTKTNKKKQSEFWDHMSIEIDENGDKRARCNYCSRTFKHTGINGTSALRTHLKRCKQFINKEAMIKQQTLPSMFESKQLLQQNDQFDESRCRRELAKMFIIAELPFRFVENEAFVSYNSVLQPKFNLPCRTTLRRNCLELYEEERGKLKQYLTKFNGRICLTTDTWTSCQNLSYLCLTCHFIDDNWKLEKKILNFCQITGHSGEAIGNVIETCLKSWGITKVLTVTVDNASSNDLCIQFLKKRFQSWGTLMLKAEYLHMRCCAHILSLTVKKGLKDLDDSIFRIHAAVRYVRSSPSRLARFKSCVVEENVESKALLSLDIETRWNSTYLMLESAVKFQKAFELLEIKDDKFRSELARDKMRGVPTEDDWAYARGILPFLKAFYDATLSISGSLFATCNQFVEEVLGVGYQIKEQCESDDPSVKLMAERMKRKHDKYWGNINNINVISFIAAVLDPRLKLSYVDYMVREVYESDKADELMRKIQYALSNLFVYYESCVEHKGESPPLNSEGSMKESSGDMAHEEHRHKKIRNKYIKNRGGERAVQKNELEKYLSEECEELNDNDVRFDVLDWWKKISCRYPILSMMAKDILAVPLSTVASESAFSTGSRVLDVFRSSLAPNMVEALICAQDWLKKSPMMSIEEDLESLQIFNSDAGVGGLGDSNTTNITTID